MRILTASRIILAATLTSIILFSCKTEKEDFVTDKATEYFLALQPGKYITYRLDSMVFVHFNKDREIHRYQVKEQVDAQVTDALGRPAYRIFRYMRDSAGTQPWNPVGTFLVTVLENKIELIEDNLRFIKLHMPITEGFSWKGNTYIADDPYLPLGFNFSNDNSDVFPFWDYFYDGGLGSFSYNGKNYTNVLTVEEVDESTNVPIVSPSSYASRSRAVERYSKDIGMVFKHYELWEYQPDPAGGTNYNYFGFGVTMWMIDHN